MQTAKHILFVEDDPKDIELTLIALKKISFGREIVVVHDGAEALDYLFYRGKYIERGKRNPILIIIDLKMPKVDGIQVLKEIKDHNTTELIPIVVLTSSKEPCDIEMCYKLGANAYVVKPVQFAEFGEKVRVIAEFWINANESPP